MTNLLRSPTWAGDELRLDPGRFPQQVSYASRLDDNCVEFTLSERGAVVRKILPQSGLPLSIALPVKAFKGVAARAMDHGIAHNQAQDQAHGAGQDPHRQRPPLGAQLLLEAPLLRGSQGR